MQYVSMCVSLYVSVCVSSFVSMCVSMSVNQQGVQKKKKEEDS